MHEHTSKLLHAINMHDYSSVQLTIRHLALRNQTIVHKLAGNLKLSPWFYLGRFSFGVGHHNAGSQLLLTLNTITSYPKKVAGNTLNSISSSRCRYIYITYNTINAVNLHLVNVQIINADTEMTIII